MKIRTPRIHLAPAPFAALFAVALSLAGALPASARDSYVHDGAEMFKASTISTLNSSISELQRSSGKEIVVVTVPSLDGKDPRAAVENTFSQQQVNGVLFFFAKAEKKDYVVGDNASKAFFKSGSFQDVHDAMRGYLRAGDPDTAIITGVNLVEDTYKGHVNSGSRSYAPSTTHRSEGGFSMGWIWLCLILLAGFLIIRAIFRAMSGPRMMPPGYGGPGYGGPGYGGPGYGGGYGGGGGGGSFFSGLLGGLGGAFIGNELFGRHDEFGGGQNAGFGGDNGGGGGYSNDNAGFQSDPGQADMGGMGGGDWGGGGGDSGGGGGDSGGGW